MQYARRFTFALLLALGAAFGVAQGVGQPADPAAPAGPATEMAPAPEVPDVAWVRLAHFSPNAPEITVNFTPTNEEAAATFSGDQFQPIDYQSFTEYVEIPAGNYTVTAQGVEGTVEQELSFARGSYFTLAAVGLVLPTDVQADQQEEGAEEGGGGFVGFFQNLFGEGEGNRDRLALQFELIEDDLTRVPNEGETLVRLVHAAPGTEPVALAVEGEQGTLVDGVEFSEASRYASYEGSVEDLEVRLSGSRAAALALDTISLESGNLNTVYVVGTPLEEAPLTIMGSSLAPVEAGAPAGDDVAAETEQAGETAGGGAAEEGAEDGAEDGAEENAEETGEEATGDEAAGDEATEGEEEPAPEEPATDGAAEEPATDEATEEPATDGAAEEPATDGATEEQPTEPATEEPATEEPATGEPATEEPAGAQ